MRLHPDKKEKKDKKDKKDKSKDSISMAGTTWDSGNKSANVSLGRLSCTAATNASGGTWKGVRGTSSQSTGKFYLEYISGYTQGGTGGWIAGFGNSSFNTGSYPGSDGNSFGVQSIGNIYGLSGAASGINITTLGTVMQVAIDIGAKKLWTRTDRTTNWNNSGSADPATGVGGMSFTTTGALFPAWSGFGDGGSTQDYCTINAGGFAFTGTIPSGFTAWDTGNPAAGGSVVTGHPFVWDSGSKNSNIALSGGNLIATQNSASNTWCGVRSDKAMTSGQFYFELTISAYDGSNGIIAALYDSATVLTTNGNFPGVNRLSIGAAVGIGGWYFAGVTNSGQPGTNTFALNHVMGFAVDMNRCLIWVKDVTSGSNWNNDAAADPVAGKRGAWIPGLGDMYIGFAGDRVGGNSDALTLNTGRSVFAGAIPSGYEALDSLGTVLTSAGSSTVSADSKYDNPMVLTVAGVGALAAASAAEVQMVLSAAGTGAFSAVAEGIHPGDFAIDGTSDFEAVGTRTVVGGQPVVIIIT